MFVFLTEKQRIMTNASCVSTQAAADWPCWKELKIVVSSIENKLSLSRERMPGPYS